MRALVISHDPSEQPGLVGARLAERGVTLEPFVVCDDIDDPVSHHPFPDLAGFDLVVAMGAPWSVDDTDTIGSWVERELVLLRDATERSLPVLGICFGAQALAAALGGCVERAPRPELGWHRVETSDDAVAQGPWFQWHVDRFTVPPGGVEIARNDVGVQAFRIGRSLGVQFHPEVDVALLSSWLPDDAEPDPLFVELGVEPRRLRTEAAWHEPTVTVNTTRLVDAFLEGARR